MENNNGSRFSVGQKVVSLVTAQGLVKGTAYEVVKAETVYRAFLGGFTTYHLVAAEGWQVHQVGNGHLVLTEAK